MSEYMRGGSHTELSGQLTDLGVRLKYPPTPDIATAVGAYLGQHAPSRSSTWLPRRWRMPIYPALAAAAILAFVLAISPDTRSAVASWLRLPGFQILPSGPVQGSLGHSLHLGTRVSLPQAQRRVRFRVMVPTLAGLQHPDEVYAGTPPLSSDSVSLLYRARPGLLRAATTGAGLLITEFQRRYFDIKKLQMGTVPRIVWLGSQPAVWLAGAPHVMYYEDPKGHLYRDSGRLAGNVLVWRHGDVVVRFEGHIPLKRAVDIARSMR